MINLTSRGLVTVLLFIAGVYANADPADCALIEAEIDRLHCYDQHFRPEAGDKEITDAAADAAIEESPVLARRAQEKVLKDLWFSITPHRPNYLLPVSYNASPDYSAYGSFGDHFDNTEVKMQLSLKANLWPQIWRDTSLWVAYTQQAYWQLYADSDASAPFRETNHEPEVIWNVPLNFNVLGFDARYAAFAYNHQSNGRSGSLSRSWDRLTAQVVMERGRLAASIKTWVRIDDSNPDDNPDIEQYMGQVHLGMVYSFDRHTLAVSIKNNLRRNNRSGIELDWTFPLTQQLKGFVQLYTGYGENLIDMENYTNRVGIGIALTDWL